MDENARREWCAEMARRREADKNSRAMRWNANPLSAYDNARRARELCGDVRSQ